MSSNSKSNQYFLQNAIVPEPFAGLQRCYCQGTSYFVKESPLKAAPTLVLIHGVGMNAYAYFTQIEQLGAEFQLVIPDLLGHGGSSNTQDQTTLGDYVEQILVLLDTLRIEQFAVIGHSLGALITMALAAQHPQRISKAIAMNGVYDRSAKSQQAVRQRAAEILLAGNSGDIDVPLKRWFGDAPEGSELVLANLVRNWLQWVPTAGYGAAYHAFAHCDEVLLDLPAEISIPILYLTASGDLNSTPAMSERMASLSKNAEFAVIEGHRHMSNLTAAQTTNHKLLDWLKR